MKNKNYNSKIDELILSELGHIMIKSNSFHSPHEGWAIIREEYCETEYELSRIKEYLDDLDEYVRYDSYINLHKKAAEKIKEKAIRCIEEAVQVAATASRYIEACDNKINDFKKLKS